MASRAAFQACSRWQSRLWGPQDDCRSWAKAGRRLTWLTVRAACSWLQAGSSWAWLLGTSYGSFPAAAGGAGIWEEGLPIAIGLTIMAAAMAMGQAGLGVTAHSPILADAGCAGIRLPASPLGPGPPQPPALGSSWAAFTGLQLPHLHLQLLVLLSELGHLSLQPSQPGLQGAPLLLGCPSRG